MAIQLPNPGLGDGQTGDNEYVMWTKVKDNFNNTTHAASRLVGGAAGNVMQVGAFGLGGSMVNINTLDLNNLQGKTHFARGSGLTNSPFPTQQNFLVQQYYHEDSWITQISQTMQESTPPRLFIRQKKAGTWDAVWVEFLSTANTQVDTSNGYIKGASPIIKLFADKIELNDEAKLQDITFEKLGVGDYLIKGSLGFAQQGWYIETPKDANGNVLVAVVYEQLANNDISVKTYAKMFDPDTGDIVANTAKPRDIPSTRWIDLRLQALPQPDITPTDNTVTTNAE